jgi:1,4-alpha-glucan branching enzyme
MSLGRFALVLHTHMPYVLSHGVSPNGADWLFEAAAESYLPLLDVCDRLIGQGISPQVTFGITPVLASQLMDSRFTNGFPRYLARMRDQAIRDRDEFAATGERAFAKRAKEAARHYAKIAADFDERWRRDIVGALRRLQDAGHIELLASSATHGYSPLLLTDDRVRDQIATGVAFYRRAFGRSPRGYWLPECAYRPAGFWIAPCVGAGMDSEPIRRQGIDDLLAEHGISYFLTESASGGPSSYTSYAGRIEAKGRRRPSEAKMEMSPYIAPRIGEHGRIRAFCRDPETAERVWSGEVGYPASPWYRDFHRKHRDGADGALGLRYWRVTDRKDETNEKQIYDPRRAMSQIRADAADFAFLVARTLRRNGDSRGIVCATYDTELFGHWWHEGPQFLLHAIEALAARDIERVTCSAYLDAVPDAPIVALPEGSWGAGGGHAVWLNDCTNWVWERIYSAERRWEALQNGGHVGEEAARFLAQARRELLLLESSDWPFLISTGGASDYSAARVRQHFTDFMALCDIVERCRTGQFPSVGEWKALAECEQRDRLGL